MKKEVMYIFGTDWIQRFAEYPIQKNAKDICFYNIDETAVIQIGASNTFDYGFVLSEET